MTFLADLEQFYGTKDLYAALGLTKLATSRDITLAYRKISLKVHPDRVEESEKDLATKKFQVIGKVYKLLSNEEQRKVYDETGSVIGEDSDIFDWKQFWTSRFGNMQDTIKSFTEEYWGSKNEEDDLKQSYLKHKGDMKKVIEDMYCRPLEAEPKFRKLIQKWISKKVVPEYSKFTKETEASKLQRKRKYQKEASLAEKNAKTFEKGVGDSVSDIAKAIAQRNEDRLKKQDAFLDNLAAKYAAPQKRKRGQSSKKK